MRLGPGSLVGLCGVVMLAALACGGGNKSAGGSGGSSGGSNGSGGRDAAAGDRPGSGASGGAGETTTDAHGTLDSGGACARSVTAACTDPPAGDGGFTLHCATTWSAATQSTYFCSRPQTTVLTAACGDLRELIDANVSVEYVYYYDASGALEAIVYNPGDGSSTCVGGPASFVVPSSCDGLAIFSCSHDGG